MDQNSLEIENLHNSACALRQEFYRDPITGYRVFTAFELRRRGKCCGCSCRHCPYALPHSSTRRPTYHPFSQNNEQDADLLWWSGGKDSYLAYLFLGEENVRPTILLSTFHSRTGTVAHQGFDYSHILKQAKLLSLDLILVPVINDYADAIKSAFTQLQERGKRIKRLVSGDLHLQGVKQWREKNLQLFEGNQQIPFHYPVWKVPYAELMKRLESTQAEIFISASTVDSIEVGTNFNREFASALPEHIDQFGENGEFHTKVIFDESDPFA